MRQLYLATIGSFAAFILFTVFFNREEFYAAKQIVSLVEWITRFILPWIALYWFIRFVKVREKEKG